ncbi:hypothetical protein DSCW_49120 [Desulfosarcina widdelii]|uniref:Lipoprotein n=1 Tax=Desulfosarcina widdelii TaxID=947919 RepID=A0A5K7Z9U9_9BACT|nr:hypothetical protein [Desulfosarcina widdelii]BBO77495.1 hypothetical protein DSCW_49120 [Desulfosarcina widdelii]
MLKNLMIVVTVCCLLGLAGCGGSSGSSDSGSSVEEKGGPLAGTWIGSANGVTHTITISGRGNTYAAAWDTSDDCFTSDSGTTVHFSSNVEILCSGYDDNQQRYVFLSINGEFDGENAISGQLYAEECGAYDEPIVLAR